MSVRACACVRCVYGREWIYCVLCPCSLAHASSFFEDDDDATAAAAIVSLVNSLHCLFFSIFFDSFPPDACACSPVSVCMPLLALKSKCNNKTIEAACTEPINSKSNFWGKRTQVYMCDAEVNISRVVNLYIVSVFSGTQKSPLVRAHTHTHTCAATA